MTRPEIGCRIRKAALNRDEVQDHQELNRHQEQVDEHYRFLFDTLDVSLAARLRENERLQTECDPLQVRPVGAPQIDRGALKVEHARVSAQLEADRLMVTDPECTRLSFQR
jgi:hypothetical protein